MGDAPHGRELELLTAEQINDLGTIANNFGGSGLFPDAKSGQAAFAKILIGRSLGLGPAQAMMGIHVVEGKPQIAATTLAGFVRESPTYDYRVLKHNDEECWIEFGWGDAPRGKVTKFEVDEHGEATIEPAWETSIGLSGFTVDEAKEANLGKWPNEEKWNASQWGKWPRNMVFARAMSNGVKWYCPDLFGGVPVYTEGDEFIEPDRRFDGDGDGQAQGLVLPDEVEAVMKRAADLGHSSLADRASVEVVIGEQPPERVAEWVAEATAELDAMEVLIADAETLPEDDDAAGWRARSKTYLDAWEALSDEEKGTDEGKRLKHEADTSLHKAMNIEEGGGVSASVKKTETGGKPKAGKAPKGGGES